MNDFPRVTIAPWKYGKQWVYSVTYDEALADLHRFVIPAHQDCGIPGHVEVVAGQIGEIRDIGGSSYDGMRHMNAEELKELVTMGWGVGCHSWSHHTVMDDPDRELRQARERIEEAIESPVTIYCSPGNNDNLTPEVQRLLPGYGYLGGMSITDDLNRPDDEDLIWINRVPLHERYWGPFDSYYDPFKRIHQAKAERGWIVDYLHCPLETAIHLYKDVTEAHHRERLETIAAQGGSECWYANPDEVVDYRYLRRHTKLVSCEAQGCFRVSIDSLPGRVANRELTIEIHTHHTAEVLCVQVNGVRVSPVPAKAGVLHLTIPVADGTEITIHHLDRRPA